MKNGSEIGSVVICTCYYDYNTALLLGCICSEHKPGFGSFTEHYLGCNESDAKIGRRCSADWNPCSRYFERIHLLSLIGFSITNDLMNLKGGEVDKQLRISRVGMIGASVLVLILAYFNPPQIFGLCILAVRLLPALGQLLLWEVFGAKAFFDGSFPRNAVRVCRLCWSKKL